MARFSLSDDSLRRLERQLRDMSAGVGSEARGKALEAATRGADAARSAAPVGSGELRDSIRVEETDGGYEIVAEAPYAAFVEFGTGVVGQRAGFPTQEDARAASEGGYAHDGRGHGEDGWTYYKDGSFRHTTGQVGRGFMAAGAEEARRVSGNARLSLRMRGA